MSQKSSHTKNCESCGRPMEYRKKWARAWGEVKYCSEECRKNKNQFDYRDQIVNLLKSRDSQKTICPSEVLTAKDKQNSIMMEYVRRSARRLAIEGKIDITQNGKPVDPENFKGPIRLRLK